MEQWLNNDKPTLADLRRLAGVWRSRGYGYVLEIDARGYCFYEETAVSCLPVGGGTLREFGERYVDLRLSPGGQAFSVRRATGVARISFRRLRALPAACVELSAHRRRDPQFNFEVFWHHFDEQYALFDLKDVDWDELYAKYRPRVGADTDSETLFATCTAMIRPLADGHVRLHSPHGHASAGRLPNIYQRLDRELEEVEDERDAATYFREQSAQRRELIRQAYIDGDYVSAAGGLLEWGRLTEQVGYLDIRAMAGLSGNAAIPDQDLAVADAAMQDCLTQLGPLPALVIDLRHNGGGYDNVALHLAGYFMDRRRLAFTKAARHGAGWTGRRRITVRPDRQHRYRGQIYILTSELTASAAEIFVLAFLRHPRAVRIGQATEGILSDFLIRHLPNGWSLTLSNEEYRAADGALYEDRGIPPHVSVSFMSRADRAADRDAMLETVLRHWRG